MNTSSLAIVAGAIALMSITDAHAADNFSVSLTSNGSSANLGFSSVESALNQLKNNELSTALPTYTETSVANASIDFRGLPITISYPTTGTALNFQVPSLGINQTFVGVTRDDSQNQLIDFLKKSGIYGQMLNALVASSPTEPLAGNPASLMSQMAGRDFGVAFDGSGGKAQGGSAIGIGLAYSNFTQGGVPVGSTSLPIYYAYSFERDPRYVLRFDLPISYNKAGGAAGAAVTFGVSLSIPISDKWTVTPKISTGGTESLDLGSVGGLLSGTVTSAYKFSIWNANFVLGNMVGFAKSIPVSVGQYSVDPKLMNEFMKNGLMISHQLGPLGITNEFFYEAEVQAWFIDTRFTGSKLYDDSYQEVGFSIGRPFGLLGGKFLRVGLNFLHSHHSNGGTVNMGYKF